MKNMSYSVSNLLFAAIACVMLYCVCVSLFWNEDPFRMSGDNSEHLAALKVWIESPFSPATPQVGGTDASARFTPYFFPFVLASKLFGFTHWQAYQYASLASAFILMGGFYVFFRALHPNPLAPLLGASIFLFGWFHPWDWSSVYEFSTLIRIMGYPSIQATGLSLCLLAHLLRALKRENFRPVDTFVLGLGIAFTIATHALTGAFLVLASAIFIASFGKAGFRTRAALLLTVGFGGLLSLAWPFYSVFEVVTGGHGRDEGWIPQLIEVSVNRRDSLTTYHPFYKLLPLLPVFIGILSGAVLAIWKKQFTMLAGTIFFLAIYVGNLFVSIPLGHRFVIYAMFFAHGAIFLYILTILEDPRVKKSRLISHPASQLVAFLLVLGVLSSSRIPAIQQALKPLPDRGMMINLEVARLTDDTSIIAGNEPDIWPLPAYGRFILSLKNPNPLVHDILDRRRANILLLNEKTPNTLRQEISTCYGVTHLLIRRKIWQPGNVRDNPLVPVLRSLGYTGNKEIPGFLLLSVPPSDVPCRPDLSARMKDQIAIFIAEIQKTRK